MKKNANNKSALMNVIGSMPEFSNVQQQKFLYLMENGADPNLKANASFSRGVTPLHAAVYYSRFAYEREPDNKVWNMIFEKLIEAGAMVSSIDFYNDTPLHTAAEYNNISAAKILIKNNAKIMSKGYKNKTPLDYAESGEMIRLLKENGAIEQ